MNPIFTLPFPEYAVSIELQKFFKPKKGYAILIPLSRQQKGMDLLLYNQRNNKAVSIQIKSSRSWSEKPKKIKKGQISSWFNRFKYKQGLANYYILFVPYPKDIKKMGKFNSNRKIKKWYDFRFIVFADKEMGNFLRNLTDKRFFYLAFDYDSKDVYLTRGIKNEVTPFKNSLLEHKVKDIKRSLY